MARTGSASASGISPSPVVSSSSNAFVPPIMPPPQAPVQATSQTEPVAPTPSVPSTTTAQTPCISNNLPVGPDISYEPPTGMQRALRSIIWDHFNFYWRSARTYQTNQETKKVEEVVTWKMRCKCKYCPKGIEGDYACESGPNGTSGPRKHIFNKLCKYYPGNVDLKKQKVLTQGDFNQLTTRGFNQKEIMEACVEMVVLDELPFSFVERKGFRNFCSKGMPLFKVPSMRTLVRTFLDMYRDRKMKLMAELKSHRICLTTDTWTSLQNYNYMVLTAHYIDSNWQMHKRVLNFCVITNHQGRTIADLIEQCLSDWGIDKVLTITVDNASANQTAMEVLRKKFRDYGSPQCILGGKNMHVRCVAHITNLIVEKGMEKLNPSILAIRNAVKFVRSSPARLEIFKKAVAREKLPYKGLVCLDIPTRWNSSFLMLESALRLKKAFKRMEEDPSGPYVTYFGEDEEVLDDFGNVIRSRTKKAKNSKKPKNKVGPPLDDDWEKCEIFVSFLRIFYEVTLRVSASLRPTIHTTLHDIVAIEEAMDKLLTLPNVIDGTSTDHLMGEIGAAMKKKYNKYFGDLKRMNPFIILGLVLDPRFKLRNVTHVLKTVLVWSQFEVNKKEIEIRDMMFAIYDEYAENLEGDKHNVKKRNRDVDITNNARRQKTSCSIDVTRTAVLKNWSKHVKENEESVITHEIDRYLKDPLVAVGTKENLGEEDEEEDTAFNEDVVEDENKIFDLLQWWKLSSTNYPVLASIARDVFAIQVSTVASESAFSTGGRVIDAFRCSLTPSSVEALICMQNWLRGDDLVPQFEDEPSIEELEFYEGIETELAKAKAPVEVEE